MSTAPQNYSRESGAGLVMFIIIGAVLLSLTAGGIFVARQRGEVANNNPAPTEQSTSENVQDVTEEVVPGPDTQDGEKQEQDKPDPTPAPANPTEDKPQSDAPAPRENQSQPESRPAPATAPSEVASTGPSQPAETSPETLPATGLAENILIAGLGLTALTLAGIKYRQARQRYIHSARQQ